MNQPIFEKVRDLLVNFLCVEEVQVTPTAKIIDDLGADSLDVVELITMVEEEYDLDIPDHDWDNKPEMTVADIVAYIEENDTSDY